MTTEILQQRLGSIKIPPSKIQIEEDIFKGMATREDIDAKFNQFGRIIQAKITKNIATIERQHNQRSGKHMLSSLLEFQQINSGSLHYSNTQHSYQAHSFHQKSSSIQCTPKNKKHPIKQSQNRSQFSTPHNKSMASLSTNVTLKRNRQTRPQTGSLEKQHLKKSQSQKLLFSPRTQKLLQQQTSLKGYEKPTKQRHQSTLSDEESVLSSDSKKNRKKTTINKFTKFIKDLVNSINTKKHQNIAMNLIQTETEKVISEFGIDYEKLKNIQNVYDREDYVLQCMDSQITDDLTQWIKQQNQRENKKSLKVQNNDMKAQEDVYYWLDMHTKYSAIKKKIKLNVFNALNDKQNKLIVQDYLKFFNSLPPQKQKNISETQKIQIQIPEPESSHQQNQIQKNLKKLVNKATTIQNQSNTPYPVKEAKEGYLLQQQQNQVHENTSKQDIKWDLEQEKEYTSYIEKVKHKMQNKRKENTMTEIETFNYFSIGFIPAMQKVDQEEKDLKYREELMKKYVDLIQLTDQELKFLADTSELLNKHLDKTEIQKVINLLDKDVLDNIELKIADQIIEKYEELRDKILESRYQFIREKVQQQHEEKSKREETLLKQQKSSSLQPKSSSSQKINTVTKMKSVQLYSQKSRIQKKLLKIINKITQQSKIKIIVQVFVYKLQRKVSEKPYFYRKNQQNSDFKQRNYPKPKEKQIILEQPQNNFFSENNYDSNNSNNHNKLTFSELKRMFHPPSKLILDLGKIDYENANLKTQKTKEIKLLKLQHQSSNNYKLQIRNNAEYEQNPENFKKYYSTGPVKIRNFKSLDNIDHEKDYNPFPGASHPQKDKFITKQLERFAAIKIQACARRYIARCKYLIKKENFLNFHQNRIQNKAIKIYKSKSILGFVTKSLSGQISQEDLRHHKVNMNNLVSFNLQDKFDLQQRPSISNNQDAQNQSTIKNVSILETLQHKKDLILMQHNKHKSVQLASKTGSGTFFFPDQRKITTDNQLTSKTNILGSTICSEYNALPPSNLKQIQQNLDDEKLKNQEALQQWKQSFHRNSLQSRQKNLRPKTSKQDLKKFLEIKLNRQDIFKDGQLYKFEQKYIENSFDDATNNKNSEIQENTHNNQLQPDQQFQQTQLKNKNQTNNLIDQQNNEDKPVRKYTIDPSAMRNILIKQKKLQFAARSGHLFVAKNAGFIYSQEDSNGLDERGNSPLYYVTKKLNKEFINYLLKMGADVNKKCSQGNTPLHIIFQSQNEEYIMKYLEAGGDLNTLNDKGETPLAFASQDFLTKLNLSNAIVKKMSIGALQADNNQILKNRIKPPKQDVENETKYYNQHAQFQYHSINNSQEQLNGSLSVQNIHKPIIKQYFPENDRLIINENQNKYHQNMMESIRSNKLKQYDTKPKQQSNQNQNNEENSKNLEY